MRPLLVALLFTATAALAARPARPIPALHRAPKVDGSLRDLSPAVPLDHLRSFKAEAAVYRTTLYVGIAVPKQEVGPADTFEVSLHFPEAGVSAPGYVFRIDATGKLQPKQDDGTPEFAEAHVKAAVTENRRGFSAEMAIPATAFPRFPLKDPLTLELCVTFHHQEDGSGQAISNCENGSMHQAIRIPDEVRRAIDVKPPPDVASLEPGDGGWLGYGILFYPRWVEADEPIDSASLKRLLPTEAVDPQAVGVGLPHRLALPHGGDLLSVLSGENPYGEPGKCDADKELRLGLFLVHGRSAERVLDFPAANCALGRATSVVLDDEGALTITYSNGATNHFTWTGDHFEQTQIG